MMFDFDNGSNFDLDDMVEADIECDFKWIQKRM